jgi:hypothetical protein
MSSGKFIQSKTALITLIAACLVVIISLGIRQTLGLFYQDFSIDLGISITPIWFCYWVAIVFVGFIWTLVWNYNR